MLKILGCIIFILKFSIYNKRIRTLLLSIFILLQSHKPLVAQDIQYRNPNTYNFNIERINSIDNSANNRIINIAHGNKIVYIITKYDLYTYNGVRFTRVLHNVKNNQQQLEFTDLIATNNDLFIATKKNGIWKYKDKKLDLILANNLKTKNISFFQVKNNLLYYYKRNGDAFYFDIKKKTPPNSLPLKIKNHHNNGNISTVISNNRKLYKWHNTEYNYLKNVPFNDFEEYLYLGNNKMVFLVNKKLYFLDKNILEKIPSLEGINVFSIKLYNKQNILLLTSSGCYMLDTTTKIVYPFHSKFKNITGEFSFVDNEKNIWIYSRKKGLIILLQEGITHLRPYLISNFQPQQIEYLKSEIFVQTTKQNYILDIAYNPVEPIGLPSNTPIQVLHRYKNDRLWVVINNRLFFSNNLPIFREVKLPNKLNFIKKGIFSVFQQDDLNFWVLEQNNLYHFLLRPQLDSSPFNTPVSEWYINYKIYDKSKGIIPINLSPVSGNNKFIKMFQGKNNKLCIAYENKILIQYGQYFRPTYSFSTENSLIGVEYSLINRTFYALTKSGIEILKNGIHNQIEKWRPDTFVSFKGQFIIDNSNDNLWWANNQALFSYNTKLKSLNILKYTNPSKNSSSNVDVYIKNKLLIDNSNNIMLATSNDIIFFNKNIFRNKKSDKEKTLQNNSLNDENATTFENISAILFIILILLSTAFFGIYFLFKHRKNRYKSLYEQKKIEGKLKEIKQQQKSLLIYKLIFWVADYVILFLLRNSLLIQQDAQAKEKHKHCDDILLAINIINTWFANKYNNIKAIDSSTPSDKISIISVEALRSNIVAIQKAFRKTIGLNKDILNINITGIDKLNNISVNEIEAIMSLLLTYIAANTTHLNLDLIQLNYGNNNLKLEFIFNNSPFQNIISLSELMEKDETINLQKMSTLGILSIINRILKVSSAQNNNPVVIDTTKNSILVVWHGVS